MQKTHDHCKTPGCYEIGYTMDDRWPHVRFCEKHGGQIIKRTVESIIDGTHPDLQPGDEDDHCDNGKSCESEVHVHSTQGAMFAADVGV